MAWLYVPIRSPAIAICLLAPGLFFPVFSVPLCAQTSGNVTVRVSEAATEMPMDQVEVKLLSFGHMSSSYWSFTDGGGHAEFRGVQRGTYNIQAKKDGYELGRDQVDVAPGQNYNIFIRLTSSSPSKPTARPSAGTVSAREAAIPEAARRELNSGNAALSSDPNASIPHYRKALELYPKYAEAWLFLAIALQKLKRPAEALETVDKAIAADPKFSKAFTLRGRLLLESRDFGKAEAALREAFRLDPQAWDPHFELARCFYNTGKINEALEEARLARDLPGSNAVTHLLMSDIHLKLGLRKEALADLDAFTKADPSSPMIPRVQQKIAELRTQP